MEMVETVDELTNKDFKTLSINDNFEKLVYLLENGKDRSVFVTDNKNHLLGFISLEQLLKSPKGSISLKKIVTKLPLIKEFDEEKILECFIEKNATLIPVTDQKETIQQVFNIFKVANNYLLGSEYNSADITETIPAKIQFGDKIDHLMAELKKNYLDYVPVEEKSQLTGFVDAQRLVNMLNPQERTSRGEKVGEKQKFEGAIEDYLAEHDSFVIDSQELYSANILLEKMEKSNSQVLYVKNPDGTITDMITLKKLLGLSFTNQNQPTGIATISVLSAPDDNIEQIARRKIATLIERHAKFFNALTESEGMVRFHKIENQSQRGMFKYESDIRISFGKGKDSVFTVKTDDWGAEKSLNRAYMKISRLISDKRKITRDSYLKKENL